MLALGHQSAGNRLGAVYVAVIIILVHASHKISVIIEYIVRSRRHDQAEGKREPRDETERSVTPGKQPGEGSRDKRHDENRSAGGDQPPGDHIKSVPLFF